MSQFPNPQYGFGPRPGGAPGFNMPGNRPPFPMGGSGGFPPQQNMMGGPGMQQNMMGGPGMMQQPMLPMRRGPPPVSHMPRLGGPPMAAGGFPGGPGMPGGRPGGFTAGQQPAGPQGSMVMPVSHGPPRATTVYVGKIAASVPDAVIRELLEACGQIKSWNPVKEPSGQSKGFGFCEYDDGEGALRSLRLLHNLKLDGQELLLKPNTATQKYLVWYEQEKEARRRQKAQEKEEQEAKKKAEAEQKAAAGEEKAEGADDKADGATDEPGTDKAAAADEPEDDDEAAQEQATDDLALTIIMGTVSSRSTPPSGAAGSDEKGSKEGREGREGKDLPGPPLSHDERRRHAAAAEQDAEAARERAMEAEFERERERKRRNEEEHRRREDREYQRRLDLWERHERDKEREREREKDRLRDAERERSRHIKADAEGRDSDDETEPWQRRSLRHHRRTEERRKRRQREMDEDAADRVKEQQELAAARAAEPEPVADEGKPAVPFSSKEPAAEAADDDAEPMDAEPTAAAAEVKAEPLVDTKDEIFQAMLAAAAAPAAAPAAASPPPGSGQPQRPQQPAGRPAAVGGLFGRKAGKMNVSALFGDDEEESTKKRKLVPIKYSDEEMRAVEDHSQAMAEAAAGAAAAAAGGGQLQQQPEQQEQPQQQEPQQEQQQQQGDGRVPVYPPGLDFTGRKTYLRHWMDTLPNTREALHAFPVRWQFMTDASLKNISAWVTKKVPELVGMEEPDLVEFIMGHVRQHAAADVMESELEPILASDAASFVMKLKRLIIYECERTAITSS